MSSAMCRPVSGEHVAEVNVLSIRHGQNHRPSLLWHFSPCCDRGAHKQEPHSHQQALSRTALPRNHLRPAFFSPYAVEPAPINSYFRPFDARPCSVLPAPWRCQARSDANGTDKAHVALREVHLFDLIVPRGPQIIDQAVGLGAPVAAVSPPELRMDRSRCAVTGGAAGNEVKRGGHGEVVHLPATRATLSPKKSER